LQSLALVGVLAAKTMIIKQGFVLVLRYIIVRIIALKVLLIGSSISILTWESFHYALSREMAQGA